LLGAALAAAGVTAPAAAAITTTSDASTLAGAMLEDGSVLAAAAFTELPPTGTPHGVSDSSLAGFPTHGGTFAILTSGNAELADDPNATGDSGEGIGGANVRGNTDFDVSVLRLDLAVPSDKNCLSVDFKFLSEEYPEYVGTGFNDAFIAELNSTTWTTSGSTITASDNFAFDQSGDPISINSTGVANMTPAYATGSTYDGATISLAAKTAVGAADANGALAGNNSLYLSIFDQGDDVYDSAAFLDNVRLITVSNPQTECAPGVTPTVEPTQLTATPVILEAIPGANVYVPTLSAKLTDSSAAGVAGKTIGFYATSILTSTESLVCSGTTGTDGVASCSGVPQALAAVLGLGYEARFAGDSAYGASTGGAGLIRLSGGDLP
jgi:hypothetical protein